MKPLALDHWPVQISLCVEWGHMDAFGHVNNTQYLRWYESARIAYFNRVGIMEHMRHTDVGPILAHSSCDYHHPITFPDTVIIHASVHHIGTTSFRMAYQCYSQALSCVASTGDSVIVMVDLSTGTPVEIPESIAEQITVLIARKIDKHD